MTVNKRQRKPKVSLGIHGGGGKVRNLSEVQKVNLGKGLFRSMKPIGGYPRMNRKGRA